MYVPKGDPTRVYFGTDTHSMGLMLGVALAWWVTAPQLGHARQRAVPMPRTISSSASAAAHRAPLPQIPVEHRIWNAAAPVLAFLSLIALVTMAVIGKQDAFAFRGGIILSSLLSVLLIAGTISDDSWMQSLMVFKPLASLGKYSYGIYLWHWPLWILSSALAPKIFKAVGPWPLIMTALLTAIAVMISWLMVEKPAATHSAVSVVVPLRTNKKNHVARVIAVDVILVLSLAGCVQGIAHAPAKTAMQIQLEQQAAQLERMQKTEHVLLRHAVPAPPKPKHEMPTGDQITAIGDSVMLASSQGLSEVFPGIQTDASVSRSIMVAPELIGNALSAGSLRQWVLIGLGTNSAITPDQLDQIRNMIGPTACWYWSMPTETVRGFHLPTRCLPTMRPHIQTMWCWWIGMPQPTRTRRCSAPTASTRAWIAISMQRRSNRPSNNGSQAAGERQATLSCPTSREERLC